MIFSENEHGVLVSHHVCQGCGRDFTVIPAAKSEEGWEGCMAPDCGSYDPDRDVDKMLEEGSVELIKVPKRYGHA